MGGNNVTPHHLLLSDTFGTIELHFATIGGRELSESGFSTGDTGNGDANADAMYKVDCWLLNSFNFPDRAFLKIDVEGAGPAVAALAVTPPGNIVPNY